MADRPLIGGRRQWVIAMREDGADRALLRAMAGQMLPPAPPWNPTLAVSSRDAVQSYYGRLASGKAALTRLQRVLSKARGAPHHPFELTRRVPVLGIDLGKETRS